MVIYCDLNADDRYNVYCSGCKAVVSGNATMPEIADYLKAGIDVRCFDCSPDTVEEIPKQLVDYGDHYFLGIGSAVFFAEWKTDVFYYGDRDLNLHKISLATYFDLKTGHGAKYVMGEISQ